MGEKQRFKRSLLIEDTQVVLHPLNRVCLAIDQVGAHGTPPSVSGQAIADAMDELLIRSWGSKNKKTRFLFIFRRKKGMQSNKYERKKLLN